MGRKGGGKGTAITMFIVHYMACLFMTSLSLPSLINNKFLRPMCPSKPLLMFQSEVHTLLFINGGPKTDD